jgi:hypothetical protein
MDERIMKDEGEMTGKTKIVYMDKSIVRWEEGTFHGDLAPTPTWACNTLPVGERSKQ